jgi:hypothetical protein
MYFSPELSPYFNRGCIKTKTGDNRLQCNFSIIPGKKTTVSIAMNAAIRNKDITDLQKRYISGICFFLHTNAVACT